MTGPPSVVDTLLARVREGLDRIHPADLADEMAAGAVVVDTRPIDQRQQHGELPGATVICRNVLEWRLDPTSPYRIPDLVGPDTKVIVVCQQGYSSTLAAASLHLLGLTRATDLVGGYEEWAKSCRTA